MSSELCVCVCLRGCVCMVNSPFNPLRVSNNRHLSQSHSSSVLGRDSSALPQQCPQSLPVPAPQSPPQGPQDDEGFAGAVVGLERGGATGRASGCAFSGWVLEGLGCWEGVLGAAAWGWLTWTESWGRC